MSNNRKKPSIECTNLHEYLKSLPQEILDSLYNHPATCLAVYRELPALAKQLIVRLLYIEQSIPQAVVSSWVSHQYQSHSKKTQETLTSLRIWKEAIMPGGLTAWMLNATFRANLRIALVGGGRPWTMSAYLEEDPRARDIAFLDNYAAERWETVLHYMVASSQQAGISEDASNTLLQSGLMARDETQDNAPVITRSGFQFLLMDRSSQVWYFILQYLNSVSARGMSLVECLSFLFQLSFSQLGKDYSTDGMSQGLLTFLQHLREFGLVYQRRRTSGRFYPTRLALNIASGDTKAKLAAEPTEGYIVVETNYRVYAYTDSSLQLALIGLFSDMLYRFPNMTVALITRESARNAFRGGITANQIITFLNLHAHPKMLKDGLSQLPPTVSDQIRLWEHERDRFTFTEGVLYNQFLSQSDYETVKNYADQLECVVWSCDTRRTLVVSQNGHNSVRNEYVTNIMTVISILKKIHGYIRGLVYCTLWYGSICLGFFFLYAPALPLMLFWPALFRKIIDIIQACWEAFNTSLLQLIFGVEFVFTGDNINHLDNAVMVMNHPTRTDWNFFWPALFHTSSSHNNKIVLKESIRKIPGAGWAMTLSRFVFLQRDWNQDKTTMDNMMDYFATTKDEGPKQILLFPEGTNLTQESRTKSKQFAEKNNLKEYKHVLHPRTAGFVHIVHGLLEREMLSAVYDCTIAYPDVTPHREPSLTIYGLEPGLIQRILIGFEAKLEMFGPAFFIFFYSKAALKDNTDIMRGQIPRRVNIHIVRHPLPQVPTTFVGLEKWIQELWQQKEAQLQKFSETQEFMPLTLEQRLPRTSTTLQPLCVMAWLTFMYWSLTTLFTSLYAALWFITISAIFYYTENYTPGIQKLELDLHFKRLKKNSKGNAEQHEEDSQDDFEHLKED